VSMVDLMMVGSMGGKANPQLGTQALAAVGLTTQPKFLLMTAFVAMNTGVTALIARNKGKKDVEQAIFWYRKAALQNHDLAIRKCIEFGVNLQAPLIDRETIRKELRCRIYPLGYLERYKFTVICTYYQGRWILSRHKKRSTWETQGGHIEAGETPLECARRELFEESGIRDADIYPVCDYWGFNAHACSNGMVFLAVVHSLGQLPDSEMKEIGLFDSLPDNLTYPFVSPKLYAEAAKLLPRR